MRRPWEPKLSGRFEVKMYDPDGNHKLTHYYDKRFLAWAAGWNWDHLTLGNHHRILDTVEVKAVYV